MDFYNKWYGNKKGKDDTFAGTSLAVRCYESHPVLKLGKGKLYGGCARTPVIKTADVYVVLQSGDMNGFQSDPWEKQQVTEIYYGIRDMDAPSNVSRFKKMVTWLCNQLHDGKTIHVGCIGGHGRTGTVISAIVAEMLEEKDAIQWVRKHYCKKAVESKEQVDFLRKHYGVSKAEPTKGGFTSNVVRRGDDGPSPVWPAGFSSQPSQLPLKSVNAPLEPAKIRREVPAGLNKATKSYGPMASNRSLWKPAKRRS